MGVSCQPSGALGGFGRNPSIESPALGALGRHGAGPLWALYAFMPDRPVPARSGEYQEHGVMHDPPGTGIGFFRLT